MYFRTLFTCWNIETKAMLDTQVNDCKKGDNLRALQRGTIYSEVDYPWGPPTSGARLLRDRSVQLLLTSSKYTQPSTVSMCSWCKLVTEHNYGKSIWQHSMLLILVKCLGTNLSLPTEITVCLIILQPNLISLMPSPHMPSGEKQSGE